MFDLLPEREEFTNPSTRVRSVASTLASMSAAGLLLRIGQGSWPLATSLALLLTALAWLAWRHLTAKQFYNSILACSAAMMITTFWISR